MSGRIKHTDLNGVVTYIINDRHVSKEEFESVEELIPGKTQGTSSLLLDKAPLMNNVIYQQEISELKGRVLTIVDASFVDPRQRIAVKDLLRQAFYKSQHNGYEFFFPNSNFAQSQTVDGPEEL